MGRLATEILNMKPKTRSLTDKDLNRFERGVFKSMAGMLMGFQVKDRRPPGPTALVSLRSTVSPS